MPQRPPPLPVAMMQLFCPCHPYVSVGMVWHASVGMVWQTMRVFLGSVAWRANGTAPVRAGTVFVQEPRLQVCLCTACRCSDVRLCQVALGCC